MVEVEILGTAGLDIVRKYQRLPTKKVSDLHYEKDDVTLLHDLIAAGDDHGKALRMVVTWLLIRAPRYWWQQFDTYRIGVEKLSESTMNTLMRDCVSSADFALDTDMRSIGNVAHLIDQGRFREAKASLPEGYLQTRLVMASYQALRRMWLQRRNHKLIEWHEFLEALVKLPHAKELIFCEPAVQG